VRGHLPSIGRAAGIRYDSIWQPLRYANRFGNRLLEAVTKSKIDSASGTIDQRTHKLPIGALVLEGPSNQMEIEVAQNAKKKIVRREYTKADVKELRAHSKAKTPIATIVKLTKRTEGSLRQKALKLGIRLGHRR
jgi:hypothetical protein